jgi:hypothetical protein
MHSSVLNSPRAVQMNILIIRAFIKFRELLATHKDLANKIEQLELQQKEHGRQLEGVYTMIRRLTAPAPAEPRPKRAIGFKTQSQVNSTAILQRGDRVSKHGVRLPNGPELNWRT